MRHQKIRQAIDRLDEAINDLARRREERLDEFERLIDELMDRQRAAEASPASHRA